MNPNGSEWLRNPHTLTGMGGCETLHPIKGVGGCETPSPRGRGLRGRVAAWAAGRVAAGRAQIILCLCMIDIYIYRYIYIYVYIYIYK